ncbi:unnamed protein product [Symbiodinium sp. CCMP2592]|nr:unnamed protein product [Symbiodinium sp. CCMP2592]
MPAERWQPIAALRSHAAAWFRVLLYLAMLCQCAPRLMDYRYAAGLLLVLAARYAGSGYAGLRRESAGLLRDFLGLQEAAQRVYCLPWRQAYEHAFIKIHMLMQYSKYGPFGSIAEYVFWSPLAVCHMLWGFFRERADDFEPELSDLEWRQTVTYEAFLCSVVGSFAFAISMLAGKVNHRYFSHRCFQSSRLWTFCLGAFACISSETPLQYASIHRRHHRFCDQEGDPHSPGRKGFLYAWAFWNADRENFEIKSAFVQDWLAKNPELLLLEVYGRYAKRVLDTVILSVLMALLAPAWLPSSLQYHPFTAAYVLGNILASNLSLAFNAFSHDSASSEKPGMCQAWDMPLYEFIGGGEAYHREHHDFPNLALYGTWYLDGSYCFFAAMARCGLVWDVKTEKTKCQAISW